VRGTLGLLALALALQPAPTRPPTHITGKIEILDKGQVKRKVIQDVVVFVDGIKAPVPDALRTEKVIITSQNKSFIPHVEAVPVGSTVTFPNMDNIMHNVFSISRGNRFDLGLYKSGKKKTHRFDKSGLVRIYCNIHPQMSAFVLILDNPYYTWAKPDGSFRIENVPPGSYTLRAWHEQAQGEAKITVREGGTGDVQLVLDASRFKKKPHLNKFGKSYKKRVTYKY
jgi:plastocyanin